MKHRKNIQEPTKPLKSGGINQAAVNGMPNSFYPIRAVSRLTGLSPDCIRAWERRHSAVIPKRVNGRRQYSSLDIDRLQWLKRAVDHGHSIGLIAAMETQKIRNLPLQKSGNDELEMAPDFPHMVDLLFQDILHFESVKIHRRLNKMAALCESADLIHKVVLPLMSKVGTAWKDQIISIAQEHMISAMLHGLLTTLTRVNVKEGAGGKLLFATPKGELHEFGILASAMLAAVKGLETLYLGTNLPATEIAGAAQKTGTCAVVLGVLYQGNHNSKDLLNQLLQTKELLPSHVDLAVGGHFPEPMVTAFSTHHLIYLKNLKDFEAFIDKYKAVP